MQPEKLQAASGFEPLSGGLADLSASMLGLKTPRNSGQISTKQLTETTISARSRKVLGSLAGTG
jgi:hypothetical protein